MRSSVAQLVEQVAVNHPVGGSSPSRGASYQNGRFSYEKRPFFYGSGFSQRVANDCRWFEIWRRCSPIEFEHTKKTILGFPC